MLLISTDFDLVPVDLSMLDWILIHPPSRALNWQTKGKPSTLSGNIVIGSYHIISYVLNHHIIATCSSFQMFLTGPFLGGVTDLFPEHVGLLMSPEPENVRSLISTMVIVAE